MTDYRPAENPILTPTMLRASRPELEVVGTFKPAGVRHESEVVLLLRVGEAPRDVPNGVVNALAAAIARLIRDPTLRQQMCAQGRVLAEQKFSSETVIRQTLALYDEATT